MLCSPMASAATKFEERVAVAYKHVQITEDEVSTAGHRVRSARSALLAAETHYEGASPKDSLDDLGQPKTRRWWRKVLIGNFTHQCRCVRNLESQLQQLRDLAAAPDAVSQALFAFRDGELAPLQETLEREQQKLRKMKGNSDAKLNEERQCAERVARAEKGLAQEERDFAKARDRQSRAEAEHQKLTAALEVLKASDAARLALWQWADCLGVSGCSGHLARHAKNWLDKNPSAAADTIQQFHERLMLRLRSSQGVLPQLPNDVKDRDVPETLTVGVAHSHPEQEEHDDKQGEERDDVDGSEERKEVVMAGPEMQSQTGQETRNGADAEEVKQANAVDQQEDEESLDGDAAQDRKVWDILNDSVVPSNEEQAEEQVDEPSDHKESEHVADEEMAEDGVEHDDGNDSAEKPAKKSRLGLDGSLRS